MRDLCCWHKRYNIDVIPLLAPVWKDDGQCASCLLLAAAWHVLYCWHYGCNPAVDTSAAAYCWHQHGVICVVGASTIDVIPLLAPVRNDSGQ